MRTWQMKTTVALIALAVLAGCGKNPAAAPEGEKRVGQYQTVKKTGAASTAKAPAASGTSQAKATTTTKKPTTTTTAGSKPTTTAPTTQGGTTSPVTTGGTTQQAATGGEGALRLTIRLWGTTPIGALKVQVFAPGATEGVDVPLQLTGPEAVWEQEDLPAGQYTLHVFAYDPDGKAIGKGETSALVQDGELRDLTLDVNTKKGDNLGIASTPEPTATPTAAPTATPSAAPTATPTPAATATPTPAPSGPGFGGTLGLRVEIF